MTKHSDKMAIPTDEEIQFYLEGLNRTQDEATVSSETAAAQKKGVDNYRRWFKEHGIPILQDLQGVWKIVQVVDDIGVKSKK